MITAIIMAVITTCMITRILVWGTTMCTGPTAITTMTTTTATMLPRPAQ